METNRTECAMGWSGGKRKADGIALPSCHRPQCEWEIPSLRIDFLMEDGRN